MLFYFKVVGVFGDDRFDAKSGDDNMPGPV